MLFNHLERQKKRNPEKNPPYPPRHGEVRGGSTVHHTDRSDAKEPPKKAERKENVVEERVGV